MRIAPIILGVVLAAIVSAPGLGPHEILLLVNESSPLSREIATRYAAGRGVPPENVVRLELPDSVRAAEAEISPEEFRGLILDPARAAVASRGIGDRVLAWVYSADFPVRVKTQPPMSLHGATFLRGDVPPSGMIATGLYASVLFRGPVAPTGAMAASVSMEVLAETLGGRMPVPSMSLAYCGARGTDRATALRVLDDGRRPGEAWRGGTVHLVTGPDIRARCRQWQFPQAAAELESLGMRVSVSSNFPVGASRVAGVMAGLAGPVPSGIRSFAPGAMGEHLTSFASSFHHPAQTKLTAWLQAGASTAAGTVVEPYSIWTKFPSARFFAHQARGCTLLECYAQSVMCPLQLFAVGDPLAAPGATGFAVRIEREESGDRIAFRTVTDPPASNTMYMFLLDGRRVGYGPASRIEVAASGLAGGHHRMRAVAYRGGFVKEQAFAESDFQVRSGGRSVHIDSPASGSVCDGLRPLTMRVSAGGSPRGVGVFAGGRKLAETAGPFPADLRLDLSGLGDGPAEFQALAVYADGVPVRSVPVRIDLATSNRPPRIDRLRVVRSAEGKDVLSAAASDPDGDALTPAWYRAPWPQSARTAAAAGIETAGAAVSMRGGDLTLSAGLSNRIDLVLLPGSADREFTARWIPGSAGGGAGPEPVGLAYRASMSTGACFFGWVPDRSAWCMGDLAGTNVRVRVSRGAPAAPSTTIRLSVRAADDGAIEGFVDDERVCRMPGAPGPLGRVGFTAVRGTTVYTDAAIAEPPGGPIPEWTRPAPAGRSGAAAAIWIRVSDGFTSSWRREDQG